MMPALRTRVPSLIPVLLLLASSAWAQGTSATLTSTTCPGTGCVSLVLAGGGQGSAHISGTWTGTLTFESAAAPCSSYSAQPVLPVVGAPVAVTTTTAGGAWYFTGSTAQCIRVRAITITGSARVTLFLAGGAGSAGFTGLTAAQLDERLPLPVAAEVTASVDTTGLATDTGQTTGNASLASIDGKLPALASGRVPVVLPAGGGGLTDTELRASAVPVSLATVPSHAVTNAGTFAVQVTSAPTTTVTGPLTDAELRATAVPVLVATESTVGITTGTALTVQGASGGVAMPVSLASVPSHAVTGPLTDTQLRATPVPVSGTFYQATQPVSGTVTATGPLTDTQLRASAVPVSGPLTDAQIRATALPVSGTVSASVTNFPATTTLAAGAATIGAISNTAFTATPAALTKGTQGANGFTVQELKDAGRSAIALSYTSAAPTVADTVVTALVKATAGTAAAGAQSIVAAGGKTLRLTAVNAQIRTTTAALPWALVTLRMSTTTTCTAASSVVAYLAQGGTAAAIGNVGQFNTQFPDGFELASGGSFCISVSGNVATNVLTFSAQGFEY